MSRIRGNKEDLRRLLDVNSMELESISRGILTQSQIFISDEKDGELEQGSLDFKEVETMLLQLVLQISNMWEHGIYPFLVNPHDIIRKGEAFLIKTANCGKPTDDGLGIKIVAPFSVREGLSSPLRQVDRLPAQVPKTAILYSVAEICRWAGRDQPPPNTRLHFALERCNNVSNEFLYI